MTPSMTHLGHACYRRMNELSDAADRSLVPMNQRQDVETWGGLTVAAHTLGREDAAEDDGWDLPQPGGTAWDEHDDDSLTPY